MAEPNALQQLQDKAEAAANTGKPIILTFAFNPERYVPWSVDFTGVNAMGETIEAAAEAALKELATDG